MDTLIEWLGKYSPAVVVLLAFAAAVLWAAKSAAEKAIEQGFARHAQEVELALARRSSFLDRVLTERWVAVNAAVSALQRIFTNLNRIRLGDSAPAGFQSEKGDIVPLTTVLEDLEINRLVIGEALHGILYERALLALDLGNARTEPAAGAAADALEENTIRLRAEMNRAFPLAEARFGPAGDPIA